MISSHPCLGGRLTITVGSIIARELVEATYRL